ncbi:MAG: glycosyltransferase family 2 protein [Gammaproteobacteria bacterium]|nr:glycosyltransferase family 2 protein [Gammaproteobacteria bacterium]
MDVSVIIVNYNTRDLVKRCIDSVLNQKNSHFEIIVVDNASQDNSVEILKGYGDKIILIANDHNHGFGKANNIGFKRVSGKNIFLLNPDAVLTDNLTLEKLRDYLKNNTTCGIVGPVVMQNERMIQPQYVYPGQNHLMKNLEALPGKIAWIIGASMFVRREVYEKLNGFDEDYFLYCEEVDLCLRARRAGWNIQVAQNVQVEHIGAASEKKSSKRDYWIRKQTGTITFYKKNYGLEEAKSLIKRDIKLAKRKLFFLKFFRNAEKQERYEAIIETCQRELLSTSFFT